MAAKAGQDEHRRELLAGLRGSVIEVGAGNGLNFPYYPATVTRVLAVEPEPYLRERAEEAARGAPVPIEVVDGVADALPAGDGEFDAGVFSLVLCSVPSQAAALGEMRRVLRHGGELRFYEHVVSDKPKVRRLQRFLEPVWKRGGGGCHLTRDTSSAIAGAGFELAEWRKLEFKPSFLATPVAQHILGRATRA
jgi:SAM-dependent methyltransferase